MRLLIGFALERHRREISSGGWPVLVRKIFHLGVYASFLLLLPITVPLVLLTRLIRPFAVIRFGGLHSTRIGHLSANTDLYFSTRSLFPPRQKTLDLFYATRPVANEQLLRMWARRLWVIRFVRLLDWVSRRLPRATFHSADNEMPRDTRNVLSATPSPLVFTVEEEHRAHRALVSLGVDPSKPFILIHGRDNAYLLRSVQSSNLNQFHYHDYRDVSIQNYVRAAEALVARGVTVIRMGAVVREAFLHRPPSVIDYPNSGYRSDFLDCYLTAHCLFFVGVGSGLDALARTFRRPIAYANVIPIEYLATWLSESLFIPKKLWKIREQRLLSFPEIFRSGVGRYLFSEQYERAGVEPRENTPEEIWDLIHEMHERLLGTWQSTPEDEILQRRFWELFPRSDLHGTIRIRIGAAYLRANRALLDDL